MKIQNDSKTELKYLKLETESQHVNFFKFSTEYILSILLFDCLILQYI